MTLNKLWLGIGIAVLIVGVTYMFLAYFVYSKEYFTYNVENDKQWYPSATVGTLLPIAITGVGIAIIYYCFRPIKLSPPPPPPSPTQVSACLQRNALNRALFKVSGRGVCGQD